MLLRINYSLLIIFGVDDRIIYLLHKSLSHLETPDSTFRIKFFDFSIAFDTIQPLLLRSKMENAGVHQSMVSW